MLQFDDNENAYYLVMANGRSLYIGEGLKIDYRDDDMEDVSIAIDEDYLKTFVFNMCDKMCDDLYDRINQQGVWSPDY